MARRKLIHVVEDNEAIRAVLERALRQFGYAVRSMVTGLELEQTLLYEKPDLIIMDVMLPGGSGYDVLRRLDERSKLDGVKVIVMSGLPRARLRPPERFAETPFLAKPFLIAELRRAVECALPPDVVQAPAPARPASASSRLILRALEQALGPR